MHMFLRILLKPLGFLLLLATASAAAPALQTTLSSRFLARGETALLEILITNGRSDGEMPAPPAVADVTIQAAGFGNKPMRGNRFAQAFQYLVSSYKVGHHVIPAMTLVVDGEKVMTQPLEFVVFNPDELKWAEATVGGLRFRYAAAFRVMKDQPYENEAVPVEIKVYIPSEMPVEDWGIPEFERDNVTCWRFEPNPTPGAINLLGRPYAAIGYPSTLSPTKSGSVGIGPATLRLVTQQVVTDGFMRREYMAVNLNIPKLELTARKLPDGAPEGFTNAVGHFTAIASTSQTEVRQGDPVSVDVEVTGSGNLDVIEAPKPIDETGWKLYESTANQRGDERRQIYGTTVFRQFMRPLSLKKEIPAFRLVYFDPDLGKYLTVLTDPIPLKVLPPLGNGAAAGTMVPPPPPAAGIPVERMTDILGLIQPAQLVAPTGFALPSWTAHLVAGLLALVLAIKSLWMRIRPKLEKDPVKLARQSALRQLEKANAQDHSVFLKKAGHFIEEWLGDKVAAEPGLQTVLKERDDLCFKQEPHPQTKVDRQRRSEILNLLRKSALLLTLSLWLGSGSDSRAEDAAAAVQSSATAAYEAADYDRAITLWLEAGPYDRLTADTFYNIGNACYRLGSPGHAALYYRRALDRDSSHVEARQNLRFLERKHGAITVPRPDHQYVLSRLRLDTWKNLLWTAAWMAGLGILFFTSTRPGAPVRVVAICGFILAPLLACVGGLAWHYYPDDSLFAPLERQAVVIAEKATLHVDAARTSPDVIDAPQGSLCEVLKLRGDWAYVGFATKTRGWIPLNQIEAVKPDSAPRPPKIAKPKADGNSA